MFEFIHQKSFKVKKELEEKERNRKWLTELKHLEEDTLVALNLLDLHLGLFKDCYTSCSKSICYEDDKYYCQGKNLFQRAFRRIIASSNQILVEKTLS